MSTITTERAREAAATAVDEGKHIAEVTRDEVQQVAADVWDQAKSLLEVAMAQMSEKSQAQREHIAETLRGFSDDLEDMASRRDLPDRATDAARQVADRTRGLSARLDGHQKAGRLARVRRFARNHRVALALGALGTGAVAVRRSRRSHPLSPSSAPPAYVPPMRSAAMEQELEVTTQDRANDLAWSPSGPTRLR